MSDYVYLFSLKSLPLCLLLMCVTILTINTDLILLKVPTPHELDQRISEHDGVHELLFSLKSLPS